MNAIIEQFFSNDVRKFTDALQHFSQRIDPGAEPTSEPLLQELTDCINQALDACSALETQLEVEHPHRLKEVQTRFREAIWPWFDKSWYMRHALAKPRGYPGDYEMLSSIYDDATKSHGVGGYLDRYFLTRTLARAVVARLASVRSFLLDEIARHSGQVAVLNVASGPCREYVGGFPLPVGTKAVFTCVDNDPLALEYAKNHVAHFLPDNVTLDFVRYNALRMTSARANVARFGRSDIIYSVGLYDYIPDVYLVPLLKGLRESLNDDGTMYVAFKDARLYNKAEYQWLVDWYFFQRTEEECDRLFEQAGFDMKMMKKIRDATGVIINYIAHCKADAVVRHDDAEALPAAQHTDGAGKPSVVGGRENS